MAMIAYGFLQHRRPRRSKAGKKESTGLRFSQLYPPCATPSANSSPDRHSDLHIAESGSATSHNRRSSAPRLRSGDLIHAAGNFSKNKAAAKELLLYLSQKTAVTKVVEASSGYYLPAFQTKHDLDIWKTVGPPVGTIHGYPPRADEEKCIRSGDELRELPKLRKESTGLFVFMTERGAPFTPDSFDWCLTGRFRANRSTATRPADLSARHPVDRAALLTVARMRRHFSDIETSVAGVAKSGRKMLSIACTSLRLRAPTWPQCPVIREQRHGLLFNRPPKLFPRRMGVGAGKIP